MTNKEDLVEKTIGYHLDAVEAANQDGCSGFDKIDKEFLAKQIVKNINYDTVLGGVDILAHIDRRITDMEIDSRKAKGKMKMQLEAGVTTLVVLKMWIYKNQ